MLTLRPLWFIMQQQQIMLTHHTVNPFGIHRRKTVIAKLSPHYSPYPAIAIAGHITDDTEDARQDPGVRFLVSPESAPVAPVGRTMNPQ